VATPCYDLACEAVINDVFRAAQLMPHGCCGAKSSQKPEQAFTSSWLTTATMRSSTLAARAVRCASGCVSSVGTDTATKARTEAGKKFYCTNVLCSSIGLRRLTMRRQKIP